MSNNFESKEIYSFTDFCKDFIEDKIWEFEEETVEISELGYLLTDEINKDGSYFNSTEKSLSYLKEWYIESMIMTQYEFDNYGKTCAIPWKEPDKWIVCMIIDGVNLILQRTDILSIDVNENIILTERIIKKIIEDMRDVTIF